MNEVLRRIEFSLRMGCKLDCNFCPQKLLLSKYFEDGDSSKVLSFENFKIILSRLEPCSDVSFAGASEPFSNPDCISMIEYAFENNHSVSLASSFTGVTSEELSRLVGKPFKQILAHIPDEEQNS